MDPRMQTTITSRSASSSFLPTFILLHVLNRHLIKVHTVITFEAGQSELEFEMEIVDDDEWEPDEEFYVKVMMMMIMMTIMIIIVSTPALQVSLDPEHDNTNLKIGPKNTMEIAILNDDDPGKKNDKD